MQSAIFQRQPTQQQEPPIIACAFIAQFNEQTGPKLITKYPESFLLLNDISLNCFSDYIIPKPELCGNIIIVEFSEQFYIAGLPCEIYNEKYKRKKVEFNFGFIISKENYLRYKLSLKQVLRNTAKLFIEMEITKKVIYEENIGKLSYYIKKVFEDLNQDQESIFIMNHSTFHVLKLQENPQKQISVDEIGSHFVPLLIKDLSTMKSKIVNFDQGMLRVINQIDGVCWVKKIEDITKMDKDLIKQYLQTLHTLKCIVFVQIIEFQNYYSLGSNFHALFHDKRLKRNCRNYLQLKKLDENQSIKEIIDDKILQLYFEFNKGQQLDKFLFENKKKLRKISVVNFINFGIANKILKMYQHYPVNLQKTQHDFYKKSEKFMDQKSSFMTITAEDSRKKNQILNQMISEELSIDEICVNLGKNKQDIQTLFQTTDIHLLMK